MGLYQKQVLCPVCKKNFPVTKVKISATKVSGRDTDFCVYYEGLNPIYYDAWVCENCGYASLSEKFEEVSDREANVIKKSISHAWKKRTIAGERNVDAAIDAFKMVLLNNQVKNAKASENARVCMRIAWMYRDKKDEKETDFMRFAAKYYGEAYEKEEFPIGGLDETTCLYIIAELYRRVNEYENAIQWFSRLIGSPESKKNQKVLEMAREQFGLTKDEMAKGG